MKKALLILVVLLALAAGMWHYSRPKPLLVHVTVAGTGVVEATVANTRAGTVMACRRARLSPASGGQIVKLPVREGQQVESGTLLLELWNEDLAAQLELVEREASAVEARAEQACVSAEVAAREARRLTRLREKGLASEEASERATGDMQSSAAACTASRASIEVAAASILAAKAAFARTRLYAPFAGTIAEVNGEVGEFVTPSPVGIPTPPAIDLIDHGCLYVSAPIDEVDAAALTTGLPARVSLDAFGDRRFNGRLRRIAPYVLDLEKQARTVQIEVDIDAGDAALLPGYSADVEVVLQTREDVLRVPTQALRADGSVLVLNTSTGKIEARTVQTGVRNWQFIEIRSGLGGGEQIVLSLDRPGVEPGAAAEAE